MADATKSTRTTRQSRTRSTARTNAPTPRLVARRIPREDEIRQRAYEIYQRRGATAGDAHTDWLQAERELAEEFGQR